MALEFIYTLNPFLLIAIITFLISLAVVLAYKFLTPQKEMKFIREEMKRLQEEMKEHKSNAKKMAEIQKTMMEYSMKQMSHSMRPTLATLILIIPVFAFLNAVAAYQPIHPGEAFNVTVVSNSDINFTSIPEINLINVNRIDNNHVYTLNGSEGTYTLWFSSGAEKKSADVIVTNEQRYATAVTKFSSGNITQITIGNKPIRPFGDYNLFGWYPGLVGTYVILSLIFSMLLRKVLKVY